MDDSGRVLGRQRVGDSSARLTQLQALIDSSRLHSRADALHDDAPLRPHHLRSAHHHPVLPNRHHAIRPFRVRTALPATPGRAGGRPTWPRWSPRCRSCRAPGSTPTTPSCSSDGRRTCRRWSGRASDRDQSRESSGCGFRPGVCPDKVGQPVPARCRLLDQVMVVQALEQAPGAIEVPVRAGSGLAGIDLPTGEHAQEVEQPLLVRCQLLIRTVESRLQRKVASPDLGQRVSGSRDQTSHVARRPGRVPAQARCDQADCQRKVPARARQLRRCGGVGTCQRPA